MIISYRAWPKWVKYSAVLMGVVFISSSAFFAWSGYLSPAAKENRAQQKAVEEIKMYQRNYETAMSTDTYGGKTPEETLKMFAQAIQSDDIDSAVKYLEFEYDGKPKKELEDGLRKAIQDGKKSLILEIIDKAEFDPEPSNKNFAWFPVVGKDGMAEHTIILSLNRYANIWKIESM
ncbi:MAG: hypothetical protein KGJ01_00455 [Patescibacteria group bacterium]|nr:hypothetical protein [Patescibacteria group bacterium]